MSNRGRIALWAAGGLAGLGLLGLLTVLAVYLSTAFVVNYARIPGSPQGPVQPAPVPAGP